MRDDFDDYYYLLRCISFMDLYIRDVVYPTICTFSSIMRYFCNFFNEFSW